MVMGGAPSDGTSNPTPCGRVAKARGLRKRSLEDREALWAGVAKCFVAGFNEASSLNAP